MKIMFASFCFLIFCFLTSAAEVAIPNIESLGQKLATVKASFLIGDTNSIQPSHLEIDLNDDGTIFEIRVFYEKSISLDVLNSTLQKQFGPPTKKLTKESGANLFEWRNETKHFAAMYSEKSVEDDKPIVLIHYLGKTRESKN